MKWWNGLISSWNKPNIKPGYPCVFWVLIKSYNQTFRNAKRGGWWMIRMEDSTLALYHFGQTLGCWIDVYLNPHTFPESWFILRTSFQFFHSTNVLTNVFAVSGRLRFYEQSSSHLLFRKKYFWAYFYKQFWITLLTVPFLRRFNFWKGIFIRIIIQRFQRNSTQNNYFIHTGDKISNVLYSKVNDFLWKIITIKCRNQSKGSNARKEPTNITNKTIEGLILLHQGHQFQGSGDISGSSQVKHPSKSAADARFKWVLQITK